MALSSGVLSGILSQAGNEPAPDWRRSITWLDYAEKRDDRVKARLINLLRPAANAKGAGAVTNGWTIDGNRVIVWQSRDAFGRSDFSWEDVPSTLIDQDASSAGRTVLHSPNLETFLGQRLPKPRRWWLW